jgi:hypothetical protein
VTDAVQDQDAQAEKLQEKVREIVMEKVAAAVQKKAEEVQKQTEPQTEEEVLPSTNRLNLRVVVDAKCSSVIWCRHCF